SRVLSARRGRSAACGRLEAPAIVGRKAVGRAVLTVGTETASGRTAALGAASPGATDPSASRLIWVVRASAARAWAARGALCSRGVLRGLWQGAEHPLVVVSLAVVDADGFVGALADDSSDSARRRTVRGHQHRGGRRGTARGRRRGCRC